MSPKVLDKSFHIVLKEHGSFSLYTHDPEALDQLWDVLVERAYAAVPSLDRLLGSGIRFVAAPTGPLASQ